MMGFLKTILIFLLVYFGFKFLFKLLKPYLIRYITKKAGQKFESFFGSMPIHQPPVEEEGKVFITKNPISEQRSSEKLGEYVDYEEVE